MEGPPTATLHPFCLRYGIVSTRLICRTSAPPTGIKESGGGKSVCEMRAVFHRCYRLHGNTYVRQGRGKRGDAGATRGTCAAAGRTTFFLAEAINFHPARSRATAASSPSPSRFSFPPPLPTSLFCSSSHLSDRCFLTRSLRLTSFLLLRVDRDRGRVPSPRGNER